MSEKYKYAEAIAHDLRDMLGYDLNEEQRAQQDGIAPELFDQEGDVSALVEAIRRAIIEMDMADPHRSDALEAISGMKNISFSQSAELWQVIVLLLKYISIKGR